MISQLTKKTKNLYVFQKSSKWFVGENKNTNKCKEFNTREQAKKYALKLKSVEIVYVQNDRDILKSRKSTVKQTRLEIKEKKKDISNNKKFISSKIKQEKSEIDKNLSRDAKKAAKKEILTKYEKLFADKDLKLKMELTSLNERLNEEIGDTRKYESIISPKSLTSYFNTERKWFTIISITSMAIIAALTSYFIITIIIPFFGNYWLINNVKYFGWPIWALLLLFIWVPGLFISVNLYRKRKLTDFQLILERKKINRALLMLAIPTVGISLIAMKTSTSYYYNSRDFERHIRSSENDDAQIWLKDDRPATSGAAASLGLSWLVIAMWSAIIIFPIYKLIKETFNGDLQQRLGSSGSYTFSFKHFKRLFDNYNYLDWMWNTLFISIITMIIIVVLSTFASYIYSRNRFKSKKTTLLLIMTLGLMPSTAAIVSFYILSIILKKTSGLDGRWLLIFLYSGGGVVGSIFNLKGYLDGISTELDDAATIDGASKLGIFFRIIFPLMKPMLPIVAIGSFVGPFGDYIMPQILFKDAHNWTLAQGLQHMQNTDETAFAAGAILIAVPITTIIAISQKLMVKDTTAGGVKG